MASALPDVALQRIVTPARNELTRLRRPSPNGVVPVSRSGWDTVLNDAGVAAVGRRFLTELLEVVDPALRSSAKRLRAVTNQFVRVVASIEDDLWYLDAFLPSAGRGQTARDALIDAGIAALDYAMDLCDLEAITPHRTNVETAMADLLAVSGSFPYPDDSCEAAFGVAFDALLDSTGIFSATRLLSAYYGRYPELVRRLNSLLSVITPEPPNLLDALHPAEALVLSERPLIALRTAIRIRELINSKLGTDAEGVATPLRELKLGVDRSAANHAGMVRVVTQLKTAETSAERASLSLDLYRRMVEGQLRPWAWTLLRICGRTAPKAPELGSLRDQLLAEGLPLLRDAAQSILAQARNASAHEDYLWDDDRGVLIVGDSFVQIEDLERATSLAYAFMAGAECGWTCTRSGSPALARLLDAEDPPGGLSAINARTALSHFGTNGLRVGRWKIDAGILSVAIDELPPRGINPCFQAVMWSSRHLGAVNRFIVTLPDSPTPAMDLTRPALDATFFVWREARLKFSAMPMSTFLPANAWARLAVELPDQAAQSVAWLAINDAVHAYLDAEEAKGALLDRVRPLISRLQLIGTSLVATISTLPQSAVGPLEEVLELVIPAVTWNESAARGLSTAPAARLEGQIRHLYESWPAVAVLPTVDARPLDQVED
jgi:hypothetical protein